MITNRTTVRGGRSTRTVEAGGEGMRAASIRVAPDGAP